MPELNKANRQVCDCDIRVLKTGEPFLFFDTANTTTTGLTGDSVYAMKKGTRAIAFQNPIEGTLTIECQVYPFKIFSLFSDGTVESEATIAKKETLTCATAGTLAIADAVAGTVFVYAEDDFGGTVIEGTYASGTFTATTTSDIAVGSKYDVGYLVTKSTGIQRICINNSRIPRDMFIQMSTLDKAEDDTLTPFIITCYKASINRDFELSFSSEGDPATLTLTLTKNSVRVQKCA